MTLREVRDPAEIAQVHARLLEPAFEPTELVTVESLVEGVAAGETEVLVTARDGEPQAVAVGDFSPGVALLSYLAVAPGHRSTGLGATLLAAAVARWLARVDPPAVVLTEVEDPACHEAHALRGDPARRVRFYARGGGRLLDVPYFQPSLGAGLPRVPGMLLVALHIDPRLEHDGRLTDAAPVVAMLEGYFDWAEGVARPADADARALFAALERPGGVPIAALEG
ncbi:GNAT family N-acetyltransferase [Actinotalea sp. M2MS4P-6]|uniref:GNAT family N-acetyltransferase n=1 Tax=Actinotalea sp. M2MS4P-6 TaxID=2983762 RepID=UPI0021E3EB0B|nr:GNAT family N-acetyltransferase [Actinotalea sp. M2MS4P-6]MCV2396409.1 GNAT family N-acetyltransferase [Actinotalea sp. M2MS4P-6]